MNPPEPERREVRVTDRTGLRTTPLGSDERLDRYLGRQFDDLSRTRIEQLIRQGAIRVEGRLPKPSQHVRPGQQIVLEVPPLEQPSARPQSIPLTVVYEDEHLIVVNKPAGLVVHPAPGHAGGTLVNALLHHCGDLSGIGGVLRPGIVHRLDKDTSGLIVAAKSEPAHRALATAIKARRVERIYQALVWGRPDPPEGTLEHWIGRSPSDRKRMTAWQPRRRSLERRWGRPGEEEAMRRLRPDSEEPLKRPPETNGVRRGEYGLEREHEEPASGRPEGIPPGARRAITHYRIERSFEPVTLVECRLETGRTHQIRVQLARLGHPVVADTVYGGGARVLAGLADFQRPLAQRVLQAVSRQALHAWRLRFIHPIERVEMTFTADWPDDLREVLDLLAEGR